MNDPEGKLAGIWGGNTTYGANNVVAQVRASGFTKSHSRSFQGDFSLIQNLDFITKGTECVGTFGLQ